MFPDVILLSNDSYSDILVLSISYDKGITKSKKMSRITHIYTPNSSACTQSVSTRGRDGLHPFQGHTNPPVQKERKRPPVSDGPLALTYFHE